MRRHVRRTPPQRTQQHYFSIAWYRGAGWMCWGTSRRPMYPLAAFRSVRATRTHGATALHPLNESRRMFSRLGAIFTPPSRRNPGPGAGDTMTSYMPYFRGRSRDSSMEIGQAGLQRRSALFHLVGHFAVMVVLMYAGMFALDPLYELLAGFAGVSDPWSRLPVLSNFAMALNMTIPMTLYMTYKRHSWGAIAEMSAAMFLPAVLTSGPFLLGSMTAGTMMTLSHAAMIPLMGLAAILRFTIMRSAARRVK